MTVHVHWARVFQSKCEADWLFSFRKYYEQRTAMAKSNTRGFFAWTDGEVDLILKVTHECKVVTSVEKIDWEASQSKYGGILKWHQEHYPLPGNGKRVPTQEG